MLEYQPSVHCLVQILVSVGGQNDNSTILLNLNRECMSKITEDITSNSITNRGCVSKVSGTPLCYYSPKYYSMRENDLVKELLLTNILVRK